jgi:cobalamin biosynthetic protein CobC
VNLFGLSESEHAGTTLERLGRAGIFVRRFSERPPSLRHGFPGAPENWAPLRRALAG